MVDNQRKYITPEVLVPHSVLGVTTTRIIRKESANPMENRKNSAKCPDQEIPL
jgi:hypothetical protein